MRAALPRVRDVFLLTWSRHEPSVVAPEAMRSVLDAGQRGHELVVVDIARRTDPACEEALSRADHTLLLVRADLAGISAASRVTQLIAPIAQRISVVAIQTSAGAVPGELVAESLALPHATSMRPDRRIAAASDEEFVTLRRRRGPLASACRIVLRQVGLLESRPA